MDNNIEYYRDQVSLARTEIKNLRQQLSSLKHEHIKQVELIKSSLNSLSCGNCSPQGSTAPTPFNTNLVAQNNSSEPLPAISYKTIGIIETGFQNKRGVPRQPQVLTAQGTVVIDNGVFNNPQHALDGLEEFSHMWIIFHFHATESNHTPAKVSPPRLQGERRGVFSTRSPHRPCPIGLSLVKIIKIEGNKIHFQGVDMVNGTPVLDIKPYIPQYDYPTPSVDNAMSTLVRPPTEGISDVTDNVAGLQIVDSFDTTNRLSPRQTTIEIDTSLSSSRTLESIPSPENLTITPISPSPEALNDTNFPRSPLRRPDTERGAPDGQERFTPPQSALPLPNDGIRIAPWINNPPSQTFQVSFTEDALARLNDLIGDRAPTFKACIEGLLSEDPRSQYVRQRYPNHEYSCVLEDLSISCLFDDSTAVCTIVAVRSADELQQN